MTGTVKPPGLRKGRLTLIIVVTAILGLVIGFTASRTWPAPVGDTSAEAGFARDMSSHHAQAVEMAMLAFQKASSPQLRALGYDIALTQQGQIGTMSAWLANWHLLPTGPEPRMSWMPDGARSISEDGLMPGMASPAEISALQTATGNAFDILFCQLMLRHHLGGLHMVDTIVTLSRNSQVTRLASSMKASQQKEMAIFRDILTQLGAQPL
jgi:uncharacterized protein (DUF305 family)